MAGSKETGSAFAGKCPGCKDELVVGWLRKVAALAEGAEVVKVEIPVLDFDVVNPLTPSKQQIAEPDPTTELATGPLTCSCGNLTATFDTTKGRAVFSWTQAAGEPAVANINLH